MRPSIQRLTAPALILAAALTVAGCGGGDSAPSDAAATTAASTTPAATAPLTTTPPGENVLGSSGELNITGGPKAGSYTVTFCIGDGDSNLSMTASLGDDEAHVNVNDTSGTLLVANTANTELTNGTVDGLSFTDETSFTGAGSYDDGTAFTLEGTCVNK